MNKWTLDFVADWFKVHFPILEYWDQIYDQTHDHHMIFCVTLGGTVAMVIWWLLGRDHVYTHGLAFGVAAMWVWYVARELVWRIKEVCQDLYWWHRAKSSLNISPDYRDYKLWDGFFDLAKGFWLFGPWVILTWHYDVPAWTGVVLWVGGWVHLLGLGFLRPRYARLSCR